MKQAHIALQEAYQSILNCQPIDIINIDLNLSWTYLGEILGKVHRENIVDELFQKFCLGK